MSIFRGDEGERGATGDHGQDGRQGVQGERGPGPTQAQVDAEADRIEDVREALAVALGEKQTRRDAVVDHRFHTVSRRLLIVYTLVTLGLLGAYAVDDRQDRRDAARDEAFRKQIVAVCKQNNAGHVRVNSALDQLAQSAQLNPLRTPEEQARVAKAYEGLKLPVTACPPG